MLLVLFNITVIIMDADTKEILNSIINKIILNFNPQKIILFGSAAKEKMSENSDFDILVVMKNGIHRRKTTQSIYKCIADIGFATDIIVVTEDDIKLYGDREETIIYHALKEGRVLFTA